MLKIKKACLLFWSLVSGRRRPGSTWDIVLDSVLIVDIGRVSSLLCHSL